MLARLVVLVLGVFAAAVLSAQAGRTPQVVTRVNVLYRMADGQRLYLDIYQPAEQAKPSAAVILIHGGGYTGFDKSIMSGTAERLAAAGFAAFSIDYRLLNYRDSPPKNQWPAQLEDCQAAVRWVRLHAGENGVDPSSVGAFGHSAGGQLAALLGMTDARDPNDPQLSSRVQAVVDVSGVNDFTTDHDPDGDALFSKLFGGTEAQRAEVWQDASPVFHVQGDDPPFLLIHGTLDQDIPLHQSEELLHALKKAGVRARLVTVSDTHFFQTDEAKRRMNDETIAFFRHELHKQN